MDFKDHFSGHADLYLKFRPRSPKELFPYLASLAPGRSLAWDVGTGNGQAARDLVPYFNRIIATDASAEQIQHASPHPQIQFEVSRAENSKIAPHSIDLITAAQAIHWFDFEQFYLEVRRVAKPGAVLAVWCYGLAKVSPELDREIQIFYDQTVGKYWPPERSVIDAEYKTIPFPFPEINTPTFSMIEERTLEMYCGYLYSWSAVQRAIKAVGPSVFHSFVDRITPLWGNPSTARKIHWPLGLRVGRVTSS